MAYKIKKAISNRSNYGSQRNVNAIIYFAVHYTANDGDSDESNARYFQNNIVKASANYFIDDDSVTESVPPNYVAWAVGGSKYPDCSKTGGGKMYGIMNNSNSLSFELCDTVKNGKYDLSKKTRENAIDFIARQMIIYHVDINHVYRHFDVNGKMCPRYFAGKENEAAWKKFKTELKAKYDSLVKPAEKKTDTKPSTKTKVAIAKPTLRRGSTGAEVKKLQHNLNALGYTGENGKKLTEDGDFGKNTEVALIKFQKAKKLSKDGVYGTNSATAMDKALNK